MPHDLIDLTKWPSMPAPWSSVDPGEAWVWGDYVALIQTGPSPVADFVAQLSGARIAPKISHQSQDLRLREGIASPQGE